MDEATPQQTDTLVQSTEPTWDSPLPETPPAEAAPVTTDAAEPTAPLEKPDETPSPALDAQPVPEPAPARESESQPETKPDEYVAEADDPPEIAALPTPSAKKWAKRNFKEAGAVRLYLDPAQPIQSFGDDLYQRSPSRYWEHVDDLIKAHPDYISEKLYGVKSPDEIKSKLQPAPQPESAPVTSTTTLTEAELATLDDTQIIQRFEAARTAARTEVEQTLRAEFDQKLNELKTQFNEVNGKFTTQEQQAREQQAIVIESELKTNVMKAVQDGIRESGLEPKSDDPPKIANLKKAAVRIINDQFEPTFDADDDNVKVVERVREFAKRLERANAFREEENLRVRALAAFEKVKQTPEVKAIMDEILAYVEQSKAKPRADNPAPPVAGAAEGITLQPATTWDGAIAQAKSA